MKWEKGGEIQREKVGRVRKRGRESESEKSESETESKKRGTDR